MKFALFLAILAVTALAQMPERQVDRCATISPKAFKEIGTDGTFVMLETFEEPHHGRECRAATYERLSACLHFQDSECADRARDRRHQGCSASRVQMGRREARVRSME
jgi:hypothetical protein